MKKDNSFVNAAMTYSAALIIIKIIGALYKVFLGNILSPTGASYVAFTYAFFNFLLAFSTVAFPAVIAKIIAEYLAQNKQDAVEELFAVMKKFMLVVGLFFALLLFVLAPVITKLGGNPDATYAMQAIAITLFILSYMAAYRGYFQGHSNLLPFGISQIADQLGRVIFGFVLATALIQFGEEIAAAGAVFSAAIGAFFGLATLLLFLKKHRRIHGIKGNVKVKLSDHCPLLKRVIYMAIPIIIGAAVMPLVNIIDSMIIINRLQDIGYGETARDFYSYHAFHSQSVINFPQVLFTAVQASLLPTISYLIAAKNFKGVGDTVKTGIKLSLLVGIPAAIGLATLAEPVIRLLYSSRPDVILNAPRVLQIGSLSLIPLCLFQATTGILQGMEKQKSPAYNFMIGAAFKVVVCYILVGIPSINIIGASFSTLLAFSIAAFLNVRMVFKSLTLDFSIVKIIAKPLISAIIMGGAVLLVYSGLNQIVNYRIAVFISIVFGMFVYGTLIIALRALDKDDLEFLPGKRILSKFIR